MSAPPPADPLNPLFIFSPNARCGITLLQRLFNSTRKMIVYGENALLAVALPAHLVGLAGQAPELDAARKRLLTGDYDFWSSSIWPSTARVQQAVVDSIRHLLGTYQQCATEDGFARWGFKNPISDGRHIRLFRDVCPQARIIFIHRHIADIVRSQKARKWLDSVGKVAAEAQRWARIMQYMADATGDDRLLVIRYEEMIASPEEWADRLETFADIRGIDRAVFDRKVNTFAGSQRNGHSPDEYIDPEELAPAEMEAIHRLAGAALRQAGYPSMADWHAARQAKVAERLKLATPV
ncbi:MAG: hypothetical protein BIFFINMI_04394 [Phycisphaerae bacterium]|nr:hypothetical protein [Phycisphaerae bacterium]